MTEGLANLFTTLVGAGGIDDTSPSLPVQDAAPPALVNQSFAILVNAGQGNQEIMEVTAGQGTTTWTVTRASEPWGATGTQSPSAHGQGEPVEAIITVAGLTAFIRGIVQGDIMYSVMDFGAQGDGSTDDTAAFQAVLNAAAPGGTVIVPQPPSQYLVMGNIAIPGRVKVLGPGWNPLTPTIKLADNSGAACVFGSRGYLTNTSMSDGPVIVRDLSVDCNGANNAGAHGICLMNYSSVIEHCYLRNPSLCGFVFSDTNSAGVVISNTAVENEIRRCKVQYDSPTVVPGQHGVWVRDTAGLGRVTDGYCTDNIVAGSGDAAICIERAAGWFIGHNHVYACQQDGMRFMKVWDAFIHHNEVDHFGKGGGAATYCGIRLESVIQNSQPGTNGRPSTFDHNIVNADESGGSPTTTFSYYRIRNGTRQGTGIVHFAHNTAHRDALGPGGSVAYDLEPNGGTLDVVGGFNVADGPLGTPMVGTGTLNQRAPSRVLYAKSQPVVVGVGGSYGTATRFPTEQFALGIVPTAIALIWGGSFASEIATCQIVATYSDGTTRTVTFDGVSNPGTQHDNDGQRYSLYPDGLHIESLDVEAKTTASATAVTLTAEIAGFNAN